MAVLELNNIGVNSEPPLTPRLGARQGLPLIITCPPAPDPGRELDDNLLERWERASLYLTQCYLGGRCTSRA